MTQPPVRLDELISYVTSQHGTALDEHTRISLARSVETKAREMSDLVSNVLDLMRFESGHMVLRRDWQTLDDLVGAAPFASRA